MLSYERTPQIERKAGQIESRCCRLSYEADKLNSGKDIIKEKPCTTKTNTINEISTFKLPTTRNRNSKSLLLPLNNDIYNSEIHKNYITISYRNRLSS